jgi:hypothetical protein
MSAADFLAYAAEHLDWSDRERQTADGRGLAGGRCPMGEGIAGRR